MDVPSVWVLDGQGWFWETGFPAAVFASVEAAEDWIFRNGLSGSLTEYPLDVAYYDFWRRSGSRPPMPGHQVLHADSVRLSFYRDGVRTRVAPLLGCSQSVWAFHGRPQVGLSAGIFREEADALRWAEVNAFTGIATEYPIDMSVYEYVKAKGWFTKELSRERLATFTSAYVDHSHVEDGEL